MFDKTIIAVTIAVALGCMSVAANAFAADHRSGEPGGRHVLSRHAWGGRGHAPGAHGARYGGGSSRALHRSMTPAMATMATAAQVLVFPMSVV